MLLILASVSITVVFGDNGILQLAKEAGEKTNEAVKNDKENIGNVTNYIKSLNWDTSKVTAVTTKDGGIVPVPKGFVGSEVDGENTVSGGFVIYEGTDPITNENVDTSKAREERNQFVWVPVFDETPIYKTNSEGKNIGLLYDFGSYDDSQKKFVAKNSPTPIEWSDNGHREPDIVRTWADSSGIEYKGDDNEENLSIVLEEGEDKTKEKFKEQLQREFDNLIASVNKYGGFYIGRYETSDLNTDSPKVISGVLPTVTMDWYTMYKNSKKIASENNSVTSSMIWGSQWDAVMNWFLSSSVETTRNYVTNSSGKGVYSQDAKTTTGSNSNYALNNIYDMAGNVYEWTVEARSFTSRVTRGGSYAVSGSDFPASYRSEGSPDSKELLSVGSRATLYVNL